MEINDSYFTISKRVEGVYKEKGSKFHAYLSPIEDLEAFEKFLIEIKKLHPKARHHCYAYLIGLDGTLFRMNDDGEPSGTAGKPIYGQLVKNKITNIAAIVVRYFGGTKLGVSGLIKAYKSATEDALNHSTIVEKILSSPIKISFEYEAMGKVLQVLKDLKIDIDRNEFGAKAFVMLKVRNSEIEQTKNRIVAKILNRDVADLTEETTQDLCVIELV